jgi:regulator of sigma E protease
MTEFDLLGVVKTVAIFLVVLSVLIAFHEWGHFLAARWIGVKVLTFSIGFGPKLWRRVVGETEYCVSAIPLGGYVRLFGDDPTEVVDPKDQRQSFLHQSTAGKLAIVAAGPFFNLVLAYLMFTGMLVAGLSLYVPTFNSLLPVIETVSDDSPAMRAGLKPGDKILSIDGQTISLWAEMTEIIARNPDRPLAFEIEREGRVMTLPVTPARKNVEMPDGKTREIGQVGIVNQMHGAVITVEHPFMAPVAGLNATWKWTELTVVSIGKLITGQVSPKNIGGPIQIAQVSAKAAETGLGNLIILMAIISVNLAVLNFLPIPVLDGGHIFFFLLEAAMGKPLKAKTRDVAQRVGIALLLMLMIFAFSNDLMRIFAP